MYFNKSFLESFCETTSNRAEEKEQVGKAGEEHSDNICRGK